ncbi:hypothetical protein Fmac_008862 [Flemingia macrophylla]|uniref:Secreted protein n=1 Tax=Flemingia macrophylla TaxID=520843 RepID=A0ABD1MZG7_9FABA
MLKYIYICDIYFTFVLIFVYLSCDGAKIFHPHVIHDEHDGHILHRSIIEAWKHLLCVFKLLLVRGSCGFFQVCINLFQV